LLHILLHNSLYQKFESTYFTEHCGPMILDSPDCLSATLTPFGLRVAGAGVDEARRLA
jgi:hypothetical protein